MSQNGPYPGPPWSSGSSDEPSYSEPADPWGDHGAAGSPGVASPEPASEWGAHPPSIPQQPVSYHSAPISGPAMWGQPTPPSPRRNTPILVLVVTLGLLIVVGLGATALMLKKRNDQKADAAAPTASATTNPAAPAPLGSEDARFYVKKGDCVINEGSDTDPALRTTPCTSGTFVVLEQFKGKTSGEKDAEKKCADVPGYTKWFFYDSSLDDLDFVLCLKEHKDL